MADTSLQDLFSEIGASFATLEADTPREMNLPCPRCGGAVFATKNQREGSWEIACCQHGDYHRSRLNLIATWNKWATPYEDRLASTNTYTS